MRAMTRCCARSQQMGATKQADLWQALKTDLPVFGGVREL